MLSMLFIVFMVSIEPRFRTCWCLYCLYSDYIVYKQGIDRSGLSMGHTHIHTLRGTHPYSYVDTLRQRLFSSLDSPTWSRLGRIENLPREQHTPLHPYRFAFAHPLKFTVRLVRLQTICDVTSRFSRPSLQFMYHIYVKHGNVSVPKNISKINFRDLIHGQL